MAHNYSFDFLFNTKVFITEKIVGFLDLIF